MRKSLLICLFDDVPGCRPKSEQRACLVKAVKQVKVLRFFRQSHILFFCHHHYSAGLILCTVCKIEIMCFIHFISPNFVFFLWQWERCSKAVEQHLPQKMFFYSDANSSSNANTLSPATAGIISVTLGTGSMRLGTSGLVLWTGPEVGFSGNWLGRNSLVGGFQGKVSELKVL